MTRALVVAAHGSHYNADSARPAWRCVDAIRQTTLFDEVTAAFWKEQPSFSTVLGNLQADDVTVVPLFSSEGYFSQMVLPAELQARDGQQITLTPAVGTAGYFAPIVARRIAQALTAQSIYPHDTAVVLAGHGTSRHQMSSDTIEHQAALLRAENRFKFVKTAYLGQSPYISAIFEENLPSPVIIVPFFIAEGLHTQDDIPTALGLHDPIYQPQQVNEHFVIYTPPVGLEDDLYQVVLALAGENPHAPREGSEWDSIPAPCINLDNCPKIGQVSLKHPDYLCHVADEDAAPDALARLETPASIRQTMRFTDDGRYRPLATTNDLPRGWLIPSANRRLAALATLYPALSASVQTRSAQQVGARQCGIYRPVENITVEQTTRLVGDICGGCVLHPTWHTDKADFPACIEPCSVWLEAAIP